MKEAPAQVPIRMVGTEPKQRPLSEVRPNTWNPNEMTAFERESLKHGFRTDGWVKSQSLLIWSTDEKGVKKDIIIDGEQRWTVAVEMGTKTGPMVMIDGITEKVARALTIKMDRKRGKFDDGKLADVLRSIHTEDASFGLSLGFEEEDMTRLLALESGAFLDEFANTPPPMTDYHAAETTRHTDPATGEEFVKFSLYLKSTDHAMLIAALAKVKKKHTLGTNAEALLKVISG